MGSVNHYFAIHLDPVIPLDGELLIRREPFPNRVRRVVSDPIIGIQGIHPASRWPQYFRDAVRRMDPPGGPLRHDAALDAEICTVADAIENLLGTVHFAAQVGTRPEDYYANIWDDFALISYTYAARLSLTVSD